MYRIVNWNDHFENNRSRDLKTLDWVPIPAKLEGDGYTELLDHENGAAHYGAWCAIVLVAAKCKPRGTLVRDRGRAHDATSLARITRVPVSVLEEVLPRLVHIGWLEIVDAQDDEVKAVTQIPQVPAEIPHDAAKERPRKGREVKGIERKGNIQQEVANSGDVRWVRLTEEELDIAVERAIDLRRKVPCSNKDEALALIRVAAIEIRTVPTCIIESAASKSRAKHCRDPAYFVATVKGESKDKGTDIDAMLEWFVIPQDRVAEVLEAKLTMAG